MSPLSSSQGSSHEPPHANSSSRLGIVSTFYVYVHDVQSARKRIVSDIINECGAQPRPFAEVINIQKERDVEASGIAVVALESDPFLRASILTHLGFLKRNNFKVICYEDGVHSRSLGARCEVLLAGAVSLLDSERPEFADELRRLLAQYVRAEVEKQNEERHVKQTMARLGVVGESYAMQTIFRWVMRASQLSDLPTLITGETGTGKEVIVNAIAHLDQKRSSGPFIALNCSSLSDGLAESELFGHRRGAFTGAYRDRKGLFRSAEGGILFLDEIGDLSDHLQIKLLRVLQENRVLGVGEDHEVSVSVRVVAATSRNLEEMMGQGKFRADLFHRLNILSVHIPPLRERPADFKPLIEHFIKKYQAIDPTKTGTVDPEFADALKRVKLPGNARQLDNLVRQALFNKTDDTPLNLSDLPPTVWRELLEQDEQTAEAAEPYKEMATESPLASESHSHLHTSLHKLLYQHNWNLSQSIEHCERILMEVALNHTRGNQSQTANLLGITPRSVYNKVRKHQLH